MNDFNKGIEFALNFLESKMVGKVVNGKLSSVITKEMLKEIRKTIPKKCDFCTNPCGNEWCSTKENK